MEQGLKLNVKGVDQIFLSFHLITPEFGLKFQVTDNIMFQRWQEKYVLQSKSWWLRCAGSAAKNGSGSGTEERQVQGERNLNASEQREIQRISTMQISQAASARGNECADPNMYPNFDCLLQYAINSCIKPSDLPLLSVAAILSLSVCGSLLLCVLLPTFCELCLVKALRIISNCIFPAK